MRRSIFALSIIGLSVGCTTDLPTQADGPSATLAAAGRSGCHTVAGLIEQTGFPPTFSGTISGDIEGDVVTQIVPGPANGAVSFSGGEQTWQVTGGNVGALIGRTVLLAIETEIVFAQPPLGRNNSRVKVVDGADRGNLTYHGTLDTSAFPFVVSVNYRGVICP